MFARRYAELESIGKSLENHLETVLGTKELPRLFELLLGPEPDIDTPDAEGNCASTQMERFSRRHNPSELADLVIALVNDPKESGCAVFGFRLLSSFFGEVIDELYSETGALEMFVPWLAPLVEMLAPQLGVGLQQLGHVSADVRRECLDSYRIWAALPSLLARFAPRVVVGDALIKAELGRVKPLVRECIGDKDATVSAHAVLTTYVIDERPPEGMVELAEEFARGRGYSDRLSGSLSVSRSYPPEPARLFARLARAQDDAAP